MIRARENTGQGAQRCKIRLESDSRYLVHVFVVDKEECFVGQDRAADKKAWIAAREKRVRIERITLQERIRSHVVIAIEKQRASVKLIASGASYHVNGSHAGDSCRQVEIEL